MSGFGGHLVFSLGQPTTAVEAAVNPFDTDLVL